MFQDIVTLNCSHNKVFFKVARPSIFKGTPSIFESILLKQIDLYRNKIMIHGKHLE